MVDRLDDLVLLLLRCDGMQAAVRTYEEETGASHTRAVRAVEKIARRHRALPVPRTSRQTLWALGATSALGLLYFLLTRLLSNTAL